MRKEDMLDIIGEIDESFIEEAAPKTFAAKRLLSVRRLVSAAACLLVAAGMGAGVFVRQNRPLPDLSGRFETVNVVRKEDYFGKNSVQMAGVLDAYVGLSYNSNYYKRKDAIPEEYVSGVIRSDVVSEQGNVLEIYGVKSVSESCAIALKSRSGSYEVYTSTAYLPKTAGEWKDSVSFEETAKITSVHYLFTDKSGERKTVEFCGFDESCIYPLIFGNGTSKVTAHSGDIDDICLVLKTDIPSLGKNGEYIFITSSGEVYANMPECTGKYNIGKSSVRKLLAYLAENSEGRELSYLQ